jgi:fructose-1,6-bisphosphatase
LGIILRSSYGGGKSIETKNDFGDIQLDTDVKCEAIILEELKKTGLVAYALSEETPKAI